MNKPDEQNQEEVKKEIETQEENISGKKEETEDISPAEVSDSTQHVKTKDNDGSKDGENVELAAKESFEMIEKVISINRITKVTKGGKNLSFSALVVVGDTNGKVGYCLDKANEVATAIKKAITGAKKNMIQVPLKGTTITHEIIGRCGGAMVLLKPAVDGTGVIASGPVRAVCDGVGIHNILTKCHRSNNPINVVKATIDGLSRLKAKK